MPTPNSPSQSSTLTFLEGKCLAHEQVDILRGAHGARQIKWIYVEQKHVIFYPVSAARARIWGGDIYCLNTDEKLRHVDDDFRFEESKKWVFFKCFGSEKDLKKYQWLQTNKKKPYFLKRWVQIAAATVLLGWIGYGVKKLVTSSGSSQHPSPTLATPTWEDLTQSDTLWQDLSPPTQRALSPASRDEQVIFSATTQTLMESQADTLVWEIQARKQTDTWFAQMLRSIIQSESRGKMNIHIAKWSDKHAGYPEVAGINLNPRLTNIKEHLKSNNNSDFNALCTKIHQFIHSPSAKNEDIRKFCKDLQELLQEKYKNFLHESIWSGREEILDCASLLLSSLENQPDTQEKVEAFYIKYYSLPALCALKKANIEISDPRVFRMMTDIAIHKGVEGSLACVGIAENHLASIGLGREFQKKWNSSVDDLKKSEAATSMNKIQKECPAFLIYILTQARWQSLSDNPPNDISRGMDARFANMYKSCTGRDFFDTEMSVGMARYIEQIAKFDGVVERSISKSDFLERLSDEHSWKLVRRYVAQGDKKYLVCYTLDPGIDNKLTQEARPKKDIIVFHGTCSNYWDEMGNHLFIPTNTGEQPGSWVGMDSSAFGELTGAKAGNMAGFVSWHARPILLFPIRKWNAWVNWTICNNITAWGEPKERLHSSPQARWVGIETNIPGRRDNAGVLPFNPWQLIVNKYISNYLVEVLGWEVLKIGSPDANIFPPFTFIKELFPDEDSSKYERISWKDAGTLYMRLKNGESSPNAWVITRLGFTDSDWKFHSETHTDDISDLERAYIWTLVKEEAYKAVLRKVVISLQTENLIPLQAEGARDTKKISPSGYTWVPGKEWKELSLPSGMTGTIELTSSMKPGDTITCPYTQKKIVIPPLPDKK